MKDCGCYATKSSADFFPVHAGMRRPEEFNNPNEHARAMRLLISDIESGGRLLCHPPCQEASAQHIAG